MAAISLSLCSLNPRFPNVTLPHSFTGLYFTPHPPLTQHRCYSYFEAYAFMGSALLLR